MVIMQYTGTDRDLWSGNTVTTTAGKTFSGNSATALDKANCVLVLLQECTSRTLWCFSSLFQVNIFMVVSMLQLYPKDCAVVLRSIIVSSVRGHNMW